MVRNFAVNNIQLGRSGIRLPHELWKFILEFKHENFKKEVREEYFMYGQLKRKFIIKEYHARVIRWCRADMDNYEVICTMLNYTESLLYGKGCKRFRARTDWYMYDSDDSSSTESGYYFSN